jgi:hypothetical protein
MAARNSQEGMIMPPYSNRSNRFDKNKQKRGKKLSQSPKESDKSGSIINMKINVGSAHEPHRKVVGPSDHQMSFPHR